MKHPTLAEQMADICLFPLGNILATPGALDLLDRAEVNAADLLLRHQHPRHHRRLPDLVELRAAQFRTDLDHHGSGSQCDDLVASGRVLSR